MDKFQQAFQHLLPEGHAWPRDQDSVLMRVLGGIAASFNELDALTSAAMVSWRPHATATRLEEWEGAVELPDACFGAIQTVEERRARVLARLRGPSGHFTDSSSACLGAVEAICENLGYPGVARYNHPFRCGRDRSGRRLGRLDGRLFVRISARSTPLRCGDRAGSRLVTRPADAIELACYLANYAPARFELNVVFED